MKRRSGFTLVELLMVVSIIAILVALIAPAVNSAIKRARDAKIRSEILGLDNALADFKGSHDVYPPSQITLYESAADWNRPEAAKHRAELRRLFGIEFDFGKDRDINGNGNKTDIIELNGQECLVFFLGGLPRKSSSGTLRLIGLSHSKSDPFHVTSNPSAGTASSRRQFFRFDQSHLVDLNGNGFPEYLDGYGTGQPFAYYREHPRYDASHCPSLNPLNPPDPSSENKLESIYYFDSPDSPYRGYQIVSAGRDGQFGVGGVLTNDPSSVLHNNDPDPSKHRGVEIDNQTNFHSGLLGYK